MEIEFSSYFYRVSEFIRTLDSNEENNQFFEFEKDFRTIPLIKVRKEALAYFGNRFIKFDLYGRDKEFFKHKYASPDKYKEYDSYAYSLSLAFIKDVRYDNNFLKANDFENYIDYSFLLGESEEMNEEGQEEERDFYRLNGFSKNQIEQLDKDRFSEENLIKNILYLASKSTEFKQKSLKDMILTIAEGIDSQKHKQYYKYLIYRAEMADL